MSTHKAFQFFVSESGIQSPEDISALGKLGVDAVLMGERFMKAEDPGVALKEFTQ